MPCAIQSGISNDCRDSIGGIELVYITELANKSTLTYASGSVTALTLTSGKKFYTFEMEQGVGTASDDPKVNASNGTYYCEHKTSLKFNKRTATISYQIKNLAQNNTMQIVKTKDATPKYWLLGYTNGMKMQDSTSPFGTAMADRNGYELEFLGMEPDMAIEIPSNLIPALLAPA